MVGEKKAPDTTGWRQARYHLNESRNHQLEVLAGKGGDLTNRGAVERGLSKKGDKSRTLLGWFNEDKRKTNTKEGVTPISGPGVTNKKLRYWKGRK